MNVVISLMASIEARHALLSGFIRMYSFSLAFNQKIFVSRRSDVSEIADLTYLNRSYVGVISFDEPRATVNRGGHGSSEARAPEQRDKTGLQVNETKTHSLLRQKGQHKKLRSAAGTKTVIQTGTKRLRETELKTTIQQQTRDRQVKYTGGKTGVRRH